MHWIAALTYCYVLLTGLAFYSPHLYWIATAAGRRADVAILASVDWAGFLAVLAWMLRTWAADMRITAADRAWGEAHEGITSATKTKPCRPSAASTSGRSTSSG